MPPLTLSAALQLILALGLLNVWFLRSSSATRYRGGESRTLRQEFDAYGLPEWFFYLVGALKSGCAAFLIAGLWFPVLVLPSSLILVGLMLGALAMHVKVKDPVLRSVPAFAMFVLSAVLVSLQLA